MRIMTVNSFVYCNPANKVSQQQKQAPVSKSCAFCGDEKTEEEKMKEEITKNLEDASLEMLKKTLKTIKKQKEYERTRQDSLPDDSFYSSTFSNVGWDL